MARPAPQIRFFVAPGGRRVAYSVDGQGPPLVCSAWWVSHVEADWEAEGFRRFFGGLAQTHTVVRYDRIGAGLSDRERERVELDDEVETLAALIEHLRFERTALLGVACAGPPAIEYAARRPERVSDIVLFGSFVRGADVGPSPVRDAVMALVRAHWGLGSTTLADLFAPGLDAPNRKALAKLQVASASADMSARLLSLTFDMEVSTTASKMATRTLVLHRKGDTAIPLVAGRELAASLPNASFRSLDGNEHLPWFGDVDDALESVQEFLGAARPPTPELEDRQLSRQGDVWLVRYAGQSIHLKDSRGLSDLAILLSAPGQEVHVGQLWSGAETTVRLGDRGDPILDEESLRSYRARLEEIEDQLADAEQLGDPGRAERLRGERAALADELRAAVGKGGRARALDDPSERARKAVSARIRATIKKIEQVHPSLGEHLKTAVKTGIYCSYGAPGDSPWTVR